MFVENLRKSILEFNTSNKPITIETVYSSSIDLIEQLIAEIVPEEKNTDETIVNVDIEVAIVAPIEQTPLEAFVNPIAVEVPKREGGQYDLDKHKYRISQIEYRKLISKNKKQVHTNPNGKVVYEDANELMDKLETQKYKKKWSRLNAFCKKDRIKQYLAKLVDSNELTKNASEIAYKHLCTMINTDLLSKKEDIEYNDADGYIVYINKNHIDII